MLYDLPSLDNTKITAMKKIIFITFTFLLLTSCYYRQDIQQGNVFTSDMVAQIKPGMTTTQVRYIMGTPVLQNTFSPNRWDYVYSLYQPMQHKYQKKQVTIFFVNGTVRSIQATP